MQADLGGGVWRAKWHPVDPELLLAACMYNGFAVLRVAGGDAPCIETLCTYEHAPGALSYGADWCHDAAASDSSGGGSSDGGSSSASASCSLAATASFYDRQVHLWSYCLPASAATG